MTGRITRGAARHPVPVDSSGSVDSSRSVDASLSVVFDAYWWGDGPPSLRHVLREIVLAWHEAFPHDEITLVMRAKCVPPHEIQQSGSVRVVHTALWPQSFAATWAVRRAAKQHGADVVLTHNFAARVPRAVSAVYLHDVLFRTNPEWFTPSERAYFSLMTRWVHRADVVFTSSRSEAARIVANSRARQVVAVGLGLSTELVSRHLREDVDPRLVTSRFFLTVGRLNVRKNLQQTVLSALLSRELTPDTPLVIVGEADGRQGLIDPRCRDAVTSGAVIFTGFVSEERLRWLYRNAYLFLFLSLGEGFGMPPLEASYFGTPVLVSDLPVFRETLGARARYVDPTNTVAIAHAITAAVRDPLQYEENAVAADLAQEHNWHAIVHAMRTNVCETRGKPSKARNVTP